MNTANTTIPNESAAAPTDTSLAGPEGALAQLTLCLTEAHLARGRLHLDRGETDLALSDLDEAIRLDPGNADARRLRGIIEPHPDHMPPAPNAHGQAGVHEPAIDAGPGPQTRFEAGYRVMARYPDNPGRGDDIIKTSFPLAPGGLLEAVEYARHMCSDESRTQRRELYDAYWTGGEDFDAVVVEYRTLAREVHLEKAALDEDGESPDEPGDS